MEREVERNLILEELFTRNYQEYHIGKAQNFANAFSIHHIFMNSFF